MNFYIMTLFPDMIMNGLNTSIIGKAMEKNLLSINAIDIRDFTTDKHRHVDDYPYGGGAGMVMQAQPVYDCYKHVETLINENSENTKKTRVLFMTPTGRTFNQDMAKELSMVENNEIGRVSHKYFIAIDKAFKARRSWNYNLLL